MKMKRLLPLAMAGVLSASLMVPAFAAETEIEVTYQETELQVTVPESGTAYINPYGLPYELDDSANTAISNQKITSLPMAIVNKSKVDLDVSATVTGKVNQGSSIEFSEDDIVAADTTKKVFVNLEVSPATTLTAADDTSKDTWYPVFGTDGTWTGSQKLLVKGEEANKSPAATPLYSGLKKTTTGNPVSGGIALFRLSGNCVEEPADDPWTESDGFTVSVAFTFKPTQTP